MDKLENMFEDHIKILSEKEPQATEDLCEALKLEAQYYKDTNEIMENLLKKMRLLPQDLNPMSVKKIEQLSNLQETLQSKDANIESLGLSLSDKHRKYAHYLAKVKLCIKTYFNLNQQLLKQITSAKSTIQTSLMRINNITTKSDEEIKILESRAGRYDKELFKLEKRYSWLKEPEFNLENIATKLEVLRNVKRELVLLQEELNKFKGLQPNIVQASQQLHTLKDEFTTLNKLFTSAK